MLSEIFGSIGSLELKETNGRRKIQALIFLVKPIIDTT